jgi:hypothetical protein
MEPCVCTPYASESSISYFKYGCKWVQVEHHRRRGSSWSRTAECRTGSKGVRRKKGRARGRCCFEVETYTNLHIAGFCSVGHIYDWASRYQKNVVPFLLLRGQAPSRNPGTRLWLHLWPRNTHEAHSRYQRSCRRHIQGYSSRPSRADWVSAFGAHGDCHFAHRPLDQRGGCRGTVQIKDRAVDVHSASQ